MQLTHKTILVTGASGGIGSEVCRLLEAAGAALVLNCISSVQLQELRQRLTRPHAGVVADVATGEGRAAIAATCHKAGGIDALINLAGILDFGLFALQQEALINRILQVNSVGPILLTRQLLPQLLQRSEARVLNVGSIFASIGHPGFVAYCASKAAIKAFSEALARELADTSVSVAYIAPRTTVTALNTDRVNALNAALGHGSDRPERVARAIVDMLAGTSRVRYLGWPEQLFVRLNSLLPGVVHAALVRKLPIIKQHAQA